MSRRNHRNKIARHVKTKLHARVIDRGEALSNEGFASITNIKVNTRFTTTLHFMVNRSGHNITRGQRAPFIILIHELRPITQHQFGTLATNRLTDQERLGLRMKETCGMKLNELHVTYRHTRPPGNGHAIPRGHIGITRVQVNLPPTPCRQNHVWRTHSNNLSTVAIHCIHAGGPIAFRIGMTQ